MMKHLKQSLTAFTAGLLGFSNVSIRVQALEPSTIQDGLYHVVDFGGTEADLGSFESYPEAVTSFEEEKDNYYNLGIVLDGTVFKMEYGIVELKHNESCDLLTTMTNSYDESEISLNGCYAVDAAYIDTDENGQQAEIEISGARGFVNISDVTLVPLDNIPTRLSTYVVQNGILVHLIKEEMDDENYGDSISLGPAPDYLSADTFYYSYDGHYFYDSGSLWALEEDLRAGNYDHAVNASDPWYNYYQFVSHRTLTSVSASAVQDYISSAMGVTGPIVTYTDMDLDGACDLLTRSQLDGTADAFWQYQYEYGANALMMLAVSIEESSWGRSSLSFSKNNLFRHAAYDSEEEADASRYRRIENSVYAHARYYISGTYASPIKNEFAGSFFGNLSGGMNVSYSSDPYWGEKMAARYYALDQALGGTDYNRYSLAIRTDGSATNVYSEPGGRVLYTTGERPDMAFVVLETSENGEWLKIQAESTLDENGEVDLSYSYSFTNDVAYIRAEDVQIVTTGSVSQLTYHTVTLDAAGGYLAGAESAVSFEVEDGGQAAATIPEKDNAVFTGWDGDLSSITKDVTLTAQYKEVDHIEFSEDPQEEYELNDRINLGQGMIKVVYADGSHEELALNTSMVWGFDFTVAGDQEVTVTAAGCTLTYPVYVSAEKDAIRTEIKKEIVAVIEKYDGLDSLTEEQSQEVIALKEKIDANVLPYLTQGQMRSFDRIMRMAYGEKIHYIVEKNDYGLGVSGMGVAIPLGNSLNRTFTMGPDTYRLRIKQGVTRDAEALMKVQADFRKASVADTFTIRMLKNYSDTESTGYLVFSINKPEDTQAGDVFTVLMINDDNDVIACYTRQTAGRITFMAPGPGKFMLIKTTTANQYTGEDPVEVVTYETSSFDQEVTIMVFNLLAAIFIVLVVLVVILLVKRRQKKAKVSKQKHKISVKKEVEDLEVTQALSIIDTQILNTQAIQKADEERQAEEKGEAEKEASPEKDETADEKEKKEDA